MPADRTLNIATLGEDPVLLELLDAGLSRADCRWIACAEPEDQLRSRAAGQISAVTIWNDWEQLAAADQIDLILVSRRPHDDESAEKRAAALRRLFQNQVPLVVVHPGCEMILAYELEMIRRDTGTRVFPYTPLIAAADLETLRARTSDETAGAGVQNTFKQWIWERSLKPAGAGMQVEVSRDQALDAFACDQFVLRQLLGDPAQVTGAGVQADEDDYSHLTVHLHTADQRMARWTAVPTREQEQIKVTVIGSDATLHWHASVDGRDSRYWSGDSSADSNNTPFRDATNGDTLLSAARFLDAVIRAVQAPDSPLALRLPGWDDVCRSLEVTDGVVRSCQRRRTIDLYHEQVSEQATFKSLMAAGGCGMLMWVLAMLFIAGIVEGLELPIREMAVWRLYPLAIFLPLLLFLGLQLLQLVFPPAKNSSP